MDPDARYALAYEKVVRILLKHLDEGVRFCIENAARLAHDAKHLEERGSVAHACALAILCFEELGKAMFYHDYKIMLQLPEVKRRFPDLAISANELRSHEIKRQRAVSALRYSLQERAMAILGSEFSLKEFLDETRILQEKGTRIREQCLYVDYLGGRWMDRPQGMKEDTMRRYVAWAAELVAGFRRWYVPSANA